MSSEITYMDYNTFKNNMYQIGDLVTADYNGHTTKMIIQSIDELETLDANFCKKVSKFYSITAQDGPNVGAIVEADSLRHVLNEGQTVNFHGNSRLYSCQILDISPDLAHYAVKLIILNGDPTYHTGLTHLTGFNTIIPIRNANKASIIPLNPLYCNCHAPKVKKVPMIITSYNFCELCRKEHKA